jgi:cephalosporin hydroxylase
MAMNPNGYFAFCPTLLNLINQRTATGATGRHFNNLPALSTLGNLHVLRELIIECKPRDTLEIGLAFGGSALTCLASLREIWGSQAYSHSAIDPYQKSVWDNVAVKLIEKERLEKNFTCMDGFSRYVLPDLIRQKRQYGLVYIDGSHLFEDVFLDMDFVNDLLPEHGIVIFDDCLDPHVAKVMKFVKRNYNHILAEIGLDKYGGQKSFPKRMANFFGYRQARGFLKVGKERREWNAPFIDF